MKKRFCIGAVILMLVCALFPVDRAAASMVVAPLSSYCLGDELYSFAKTASGYDMGQFKISLQSEDMESTGATEFVPVKDTNTIVRYVFLIDRSGSMSYHMEKVNAYIDSIMDCEKQEAFYTIAAFGEKFEIVKENLTDKNAVKETLDSFSYVEQMTDPYSGIESALIFLDGYARGSGDLIHLILITDGDPDFGDEDVKEEQLAKSASQRILHSPEILVSTLCTDRWDETAQKTFTKGKGVHSTISDTEGAQNAGKDVTAYIDKLSRLKIKLTASPVKDRVSCIINMQGTTPEGQMANLDVELSDVANLKMFSNQQGDHSDGGEEQSEDGFTLPDGSEDPDIELPDETQTPEDGDLPDETKAPEDSETPDDESKPQEETVPKDGAVSEGAVTGDGISASAKDSKTGIPMWLIFTVGGVFVVLIIYIIILAGKIRRKRSQTVSPLGTQGIPKETQSPKAGGSNSGIAMKLEVLYGNCPNKEMKLSLVNELTIGSDEKCDIVFQNPDVSPVNSRIVFRNGMIYIEDMNSASGTAVGGMRIQGSNRLRSGDIISIGEVEFTLKF